MMAINSDFRSAGLLSSTFVNTECFHILGIVFVSSVNEVLKILLCFQSLSIQHPNDSLLEITDGDVSQTPPDSAAQNAASPWG